MTAFPIIETIQVVVLENTARLVGNYRYRWGK